MSPMLALLFAARTLAVLGGSCGMERLTMEGAYGCNWNQEGDDNMYCNLACTSDLHATQTDEKKAELRPPHMEKCGREYRTSIEVTCAKPMNEFPNACSSTGPLQFVRKGRD